jgi:hypothetical protein
MSVGSAQGWWRDRGTDVWRAVQDAVTAVHGSVEAGDKNWRFIRRPLDSWMRHDRSAAGENEC